VYLNESTRHADVILPPPSPLQRSHYDFAFTALGVRNFANYSPPVLPRPQEQPDEWEILLRLTAIVAGLAAEADIEPLDDQVLMTMINRAVTDRRSPLCGREPADVLQALTGSRGPERMLDFLLRSGPYGDAFGNGEGLTLQKLLEHPHGIDLGPLQPRIPEVISTESGKIEMAPAQILEQLSILEEMIRAEPAPMVLVGRRTLRSNNSWMHNLEVLVKGKPRCTLQINPADARARGIAEGDGVRITAATGSVVAPAEVTDRIMSGVVSLPHGWGHTMDGAQLGVARRRPGVNSNLLSPADQLDPLSGNATLTAIPVDIERQVPDG
jgi:anaerobic selenocysteine-containing dehydrogenase